MADIAITTYTNKTYKSGASTVVPGFVEGSPGSPINPPGSGATHNPVTIGSPANGLSITDDQVLTYDGSTIPTAAVIGRYEIDTSGTTAPVGTKDIRYNNATQISATQLFISDITEDNIDVDLFLSLIKQGSALVIQDRDDHLNYQTYEVSGTPTFASATWTFPVTFKDSGGTGTTNFANNHKVLLSALSSGSGGSKWTDVGANIYRDSAVAIGRTTIPTNATFAVQSKTATGVNQFFQLLNNAGTVLASLSQEGSFGINTSSTTNVALITRAFNDTTATAAFRALNNSNSILFEITGATVRANVPFSCGNLSPINGVSAVFKPISFDIALRVVNSSNSATIDITGAGVYQSLFGAFFGANALGLNPTGRVDIRGAGTTTGITLLLEDSTGANTFEFLDNGNLSIPSTNGAKIGTATSQKIGFWNATPIIQPTTGVAESAFVENAGGTAVNDDSTFDGYTLRQVVKALRDAGLLA